MDVRHIHDADQTDRTTMDERSPTDQAIKHVEEVARSIRRMRERLALLGPPAAMQILELLESDLLRVRRIPMPTNRPLTAEEINSRDLRCVCYHEAAHCVVAQALGADAYVTIDGPRAVDPLKERVWIGQCHYEPSLDKSELRLLGVAGTIAEVLRVDPDVTAENFQEFLELSIFELSETDHQAIKDVGFDDLSRCVDLVRRSWPEIQEFAEQMISRYSAEVSNA